MGYGRLLGQQVLGALPTVVVNAETGSTITLSKGALALNAVENNGVWTFTCPSLGTWIASDGAATTTVDVDNLKLYNVEISSVDPSPYVIPSLAAVMASCGVSYWASTEENASEYLSGKLDTYLATIATPPASYAEWLGISRPSALFTVNSGGVMQFNSGVANKMLEFVRWFNQEEGVVSGGSAVGNAESASVEKILNSRLEGSASTSWVDSDTLRLSFDGLTISNSGYNGIGVYFFIPINNYSSRTVLTVESFTVSTTAIDGPRLYARYIDSPVTALGNWFNLSVGSSIDLAFPPASNNYISIGFIMLKNGSSLFGDIDISISGQNSFISDYTALVTPSALVSVPSALASNETLNLTPSVSLTQGMSVADASDAIYDGIISEGGLTAEIES